MKSLAANIFITDAGRADFDKREKSDCTVRAVAGLFNVHYSVAHKALRKAGRRSRCCFHFQENHKKIIINGFMLEHRAINMQLGKFVEEFKSHDRVIVNIYGHVFFFTNGVIHDSKSSLPYLTPRKKVKAYYALKAIE